MKESTIINKLNTILPPNVVEIINSKYQTIDSLLKPYNLPIQTDLLLLILISLVFIFIISKLFGGNNNRNRSRHGNDSGNKKTKRGNSIVILGLSNSGKTTLFLNLTNVDKKLSTHTSITTNNGVYINKNKKKLPIVDVPGNGKAKASLNQILSSAGCIIYTIDSTTFIDNSTPEAQYLYDILTNESVYQKRIPILIFNNKSDLDSSIDTEQVTSILERELDDLRRTRGATPIVLGQEEDKKEIYLGIEGTPFQFDHLQNDVQFACGSAVSPSSNNNNETDEGSKEITEITNFIQTTIN